MKLNILILTFSASLLLFACSKKEDDNIIDNNANDTSSAAVSTTISGGNWKITYFWDTDHDETADFAGYKFTFTGGGKIMAVRAANSQNGTWSIGTDNSKTKLNITFPAGGIFEDLNEDWEVTERTNTRIKLQHTSGGGGGTDFLTFEKN